MNAKNSITPIITGAAVTMAVGTAAYMMSGKSSKAKKKQLKKTNKIKTKLWKYKKI